MTSLASRLPHVLRKLASSPLFTLVSVLTLALGIAGSTAVFSVVNGVLLRPLPFEDAERLVGVWHTAPGLGIDALNQGPAFHFTYRDLSESFEDVGMWDPGRVTVTGLDQPERVPAMWVTDGTLPLLGVRPELGRLFTREDDSPGVAETVILSHGYWQSRFGGDPGVVGRTLLAEGRVVEIIGVLPAGLQFLDYEPSLYLPFQFDLGEVYVGNFSYQGVARLRPGVSVAQANHELERLMDVALERFPMPVGFTMEMVADARMAPDVHPLKEDVVGDVGNVLWVLLGTVGLVLVVACANVANLFLVRAEGRQQELAIRSALGASRGRLAVGFLAEALVLGLAAGAVGLGLAWAGIRLLVALGPQQLPRLDEITVDPTVLLFNLGVSLLAGLLFGLLPVLRLGAGKMAGALKEGGRGYISGRERHRARSTLVVSQVAMALVLLVGSGLMARSFLALSAVHPGFEGPEDVLTVRLSIPEAEVDEDVAVARAHEQIRDKLDEIPGVVSVAAATSVPMDGWNSMDPVFVEEFPEQGERLPPIRRFKWVMPGYFETIGNPVIAGRAITWVDVHDRALVAVVTENLAREYWDQPTAAVGKRIRAYPEDPWREIVGVAGDVHDAGVDQQAPPVVYWPMLLDRWFTNEIHAQRSMRYVIRSPRVGTPALLDEVRQAVWSVNRNLPLADVQTLDEILHRSMARTSFTMAMLALAAVVAALLGAVGIYGVTSYAVTQRTREIGVRMVRGARRGQVGLLVLWQGLLLSGLGIVVGVLAAVGLTRLMAALLYGVSPVDPITYLTVALSLAAIAAAASWVPARRAAGIDPSEALRWE